MFILVSHCQSEINVSFSIKRKAENVFPRDIESTVGLFAAQGYISQYPMIL